jgi:hypothetical protein
MSDGDWRRRRLLFALLVFQERGQRGYRSTVRVLLRLLPQRMQKLAVAGLDTPHCGQARA